VSSKIQELMTDLATKTHEVERARRALERRLAPHEHQMVIVMAQVERIKKRYQPVIEVAEDLRDQTRAALDAATIQAFTAGEFPNGKKRVNLEHRAYVAVTKRTRFVVTDPMAAINFLVEKEMPDALASVKFTRGTESSIFQVYKEFPGVEKQVKMSVQASLPKEEKVSAT
jgi:hypothetical protein